MPPLPPTDRHDDAVGVLPPPILLSLLPLLLLRSQLGICLGTRHRLCHPILALPAAAAAAAAATIAVTVAASAIIRIVPLLLSASTALLAAYFFIASAAAATAIGTAVALVLALCLFLVPPMFLVGSFAFISQTPFGLASVDHLDASQQHTCEL